MATSSPSLFRFASGAYWTAGSSLALTLISAAAQVVLGLLLTEEDFGLYAIAIAVASVVQVVRDGGSRLIATRTDPASLPRFHDSLVRYSVVAAAAATPLLFLLGWGAGNVYGRPTLVGLVGVIAAAIPLGFYAPVGFGALAAELRFRRLGALQVGSALIRQAGAVVLALAGFGPFSFVLPLLAVNAFESAAAWVSTVEVRKRRPSEGPTRVPRAPSLLAASGAWLAFLYLNVDYLILGALLPLPLVGMYYFGYQIVQRFTAVIDSLRSVAIPAFSQRGVSAPWFAASSALLLQAATALSMTIVLSAHPLLRLVWGERWVGSIGTVIALAISLPYYIHARLTEMATIGKGQMSRWNLQVGLRILGVAAAATAGGLAFGDRSDPTQAAAVVSAGIVMSSLTMSGMTARKEGLWSSRVRGWLLVRIPVLLLVALGLNGLIDRLALGDGVRVVVGLLLGLTVAALHLATDRSTLVDARTLLRSRSA